jgi:hypothetical protein
MNWSLTYKQITVIIGVLVALAIVAGMFVSHSTVDLSYSTPLPGGITDSFDLSKISRFISLAIF